MSLSFQAMFKFPRLSYKLYITISLFTLESKCIYHLSLLISRFIVSLFFNLAIICWECQSSEYLSEFWQSVPCEAISTPFCFPSSSLGAGEACWSATGLDVLTRVAKCAVDVFSVQANGTDRLFFKGTMKWDIVREPASSIVWFPWTEVGEERFHSFPLFAGFQNSSLVSWHSQWLFFSFFFAFVLSAFQSLGFSAVNEAT